MKKSFRFIVPAAALLGSFLFYNWFGGLAKHQPNFLLYPISRGVQLFSSLDFLFLADKGYYTVTHGGTPLVIEKSCSGGVFMVICFSLLAFTQVPRFKKFTSQLVCLVASALLSYIVAVVASVMRIVTSITFWDFDMPIDPILIHNVLGIITFVTLISISFILSEKLVTKILGKESARFEG